MHKLVNTAYDVAKEGLGFTKFKELCDLQQKNGLDLGSQYRNEKMCQQFVDKIAAAEQEQCVKEINNARFLCIMADGSTDKSITEQETVYVCCAGSNGHPTTLFADLVPLKSADAGVTEAIKEGLETVGVDEVLKKKMACCNFDGASVTMGHRSGVSKRLQETVQRPLCIIHCVAHNLKLAVLDAISKTPLSYSICRNSEIRF